MEINNEKKGKMKRLRFISVVVTLVCMTLTCMMLVVGCGRIANPFYEEEYFRYQVINERVRIIGLSDLGREQRFIVIPREISGMPVTAVEHSVLIGTRQANFESENLEKVFMISSVTTTMSAPDGLKFFVIEFSGTAGGMRTGRGTSYSARSVWENGSLNFRDAFTPANITYWLNYDTERNNGVHWIDDVPSEDLIEFIPPNPTREGFVFNGWYKEPELTNRWNFNKDAMPNEDLELFAKWREYCWRLGETFLNKNPEPCA